MARIVVIGGIESTYRNAQVLHELGEEIALFVTRGEKSRGWEGVKMIDPSKFPFSKKVKTLVVDGHINDHCETIRALRPDFIYSLGWQQIYSPEMMEICPVIGIHESLLPEGAGAVPIANAILHDFTRTGISLFWLDGGMDTGSLIGQLRGLLDPRTSTATALYEEAMELGARILKMFVPEINRGSAPRISQNPALRTSFGKVNWEKWPTEKVDRARVYPYG